MYSIEHCTSISSCLRHVITKSELRHEWTELTGTQSSTEALHRLQPKDGYI